jgi:hypothetical protein
MKPLALICVLLLLATQATTAQNNKRTSRKPAPPHVTTQTAITKEGRTVLLKSDGTWEYAADPVSTPSPAVTTALAPTPSVVATIESPAPTSEPAQPNDLDVVGTWAVKLIGAGGQMLPITLQVDSMAKEPGFGAGDLRAILDFGAKKSGWTDFKIQNRKFTAKFSSGAETLQLEGQLTSSGITGVASLPSGESGSFVGIRSGTETTPVGFGVLTVQAGIVYKMGGAQPVARTTFHLLRRDLLEILGGVGLRSERNMNLLQTFAFATRYHTTTKNYAEFYQVAAAAISPNIVATMVTDFSGIGQFSSIPAGTYYLMGYTETRGGFALWNVPVAVSTGQNGIVLDQNNAAIAL